MLIFEGSTNMDVVVSVQVWLSPANLNLDQAERRIRILPSLLKFYISVGSVCVGAVKGSTLWH